MPSTVVSILPFKLHEPKPGQFPSLYQMDAVKKGDVGILLIETAQYPELVPFADDKTPPRMIDIISEKVAAGIVTDYINAQYGIDFEVVELKDGTTAQALPGIFWLNGVWSKERVKSEKRQELEQARRNQTLWFSNLVKQADDDWKRYGRHNVISDIQRRAADWLEVEARPWNFDPTQPENIKICPMCTTQVSPMAVLCAACGYILDPSKFDPSRFFGGKAGSLGNMGIDLSKINK